MKESIHISSFVNAIIKGGCGHKPGPNSRCHTCICLNRNGLVKIIIVNNIMGTFFIWHLNSTLGRLNTCVHCFLNTRCKKGAIQ